MSGLLLDTNAFAMVLTDDPRLTDAARDAILGASRVAVVSRWVSVQRTLVA